MSVEGSISEKPKLLKVGDKVTIVMKVLYGEMPVTFTIIDDKFIKQTTRLVR